MILMIGQILERQVGVIDEELVVRVAGLVGVREIAVQMSSSRTVISTARRLFCFSISLPVSFTRFASASLVAGE